MKIFSHDVGLISGIVAGYDSNTLKLTVAVPNGELQQLASSSSGHGTSKPNRKPNHNLDRNLNPYLSLFLRSGDLTSHQIKAI